MLQRILVPLDGSTSAEEAIPVAARMARGAGGTLILLRVQPSGTIALERVQTIEHEPAPEQAAHATAVTYLAQLAARQELSSVQTERIVRIVRAGAEAEDILEAASASSADLIVLYRGERSRSPRALLERVAERVAQHATVPVLLLSARQPLAAEARNDPACALRLLVPLDGSLLAEAALAPALHLLEALVQPAQGVLHLVQVVLDRTQWRWAAQYLARVADQIRAGALGSNPPTVTWSVVLNVDVAEALSRVAAVGEDMAGHMTWSIARDLRTPPRDDSAVQPQVAPPSGAFPQCDLIAMTTHGRSGLQRWVLGSVAERVLRQTDLPLFLIHPQLHELPAMSLAQEPDVEQWRI